MEQFIISHFAELLWTIAVGILYGIYKQIKKSLTTLIEDNQNTKEGVKALLHDRLIQKCTYLINEQKYVTTDDLEEVEELNDPYKALGGNGTVKTAILKVKELHLK